MRSPIADKRWLTLLTGVFPLSLTAQDNLPSDVPVKTAEELLADLKDLHLPESPHWWPPAPGWWVLAGIVCLLIYLALAMVNRRKHKTVGHWRQSALNHIDTLQTKLHDGTALNQVLAESSVLMRRVALATRTDREVATVQHESWLQMLDRLGKTDQYSGGIGRLLLDHPYKRHTDVKQQQVGELLLLMRNTINHAAEQANA